MKKYYILATVPVLALASLAFTLGGGNLGPTSGASSVTSITVSNAGAVMAANNGSDFASLQITGNRLGTQLATGSSMIDLSNAIGIYQGQWVGVNNGLGGPWSFGIWNGGPASPGNWNQFSHNLGLIGGLTVGSIGSMPSNGTVNIFYSGGNPAYQNTNVGGLITDENFFRLVGYDPKQAVYMSMGAGLWNNGSPTTTPIQDCQFGVSGDFYHQTLSLTGTEMDRVIFIAANPPNDIAFSSTQGMAIGTRAVEYLDCSNKVVYFGSYVNNHTNFSPRTPNYTYALKIDEAGNSVDMQGLTANGFVNLSGNNVNVGGNANIGFSQFGNYTAFQGDGTMGSGAGLYFSQSGGQFFETTSNSGHSLIIGPRTQQPYIELRDTGLINLNTNVNISGQLTGNAYKAGITNIGNLATSQIITFAKPFTAAVGTNYTPCISFSGGSFPAAPPEYDTITTNGFRVLISVGLSGGINAIYTAIPWN